MTTEISPTDLVAIIKACRESGVSEFDCGALKLKFKAVNAPASQELSFSAPDLTPAQVEHDLLNRNLAAAQEELDYLKIADPLEYEERIYLNELTKDENDE